MRRKALRELKLIHAAVGTSMLAIPATAAAVGDSVAQAPSTTPSPAPAPAPAPVSIHVKRRSRTALVEQPLNVRGRLTPREPGRRVRLQERSGRHWRTLTSSLTGPRGGFRLRLRPSGTGTHRLRVVLGGGGSSDAHTAAAAGHEVPASAGAGTLTVYRESVASWYDDGGSTACGFHAHYGVASPGLPCGTKVSFRYGGRTVSAVVDDRGPYVSGRDWDLDQETAGALGFAGVQTVWSSD